MDYKSKKIVIADLDGTIAPSKQVMDKEMSSLIVKLLDKRDFAVMSGGAYAQFQEQFLPGLSCPEEKLKRVYMFPTCATRFYRYQKGGWAEIYAEFLTESEKKTIKDAFPVALILAKYEKPERTYGEIVEDRGTQISFSGLGQEAPLELKSSWDPDQKKRLLIKKYLDKIIPQFEVRLGGTSTIDVTKKGIDKAYGIKKVHEVLGYEINDMVYIGDALYEGGNDYPVKAAGVDSISIKDPEETKKILKEIVGLK